MQELSIQTQVTANYQAILKKIKKACEKSKQPSRVKLIWVTKYQSKKITEQAVNYQAFELGENKVQTVLEKYPLNSNLSYNLNFIGHLQSNKVRKIVPLASAIHSVDSPKLLQQIIKVCEEQQKKISVFFQLNISGETSKSGFTPKDFLNYAQHLTPNPWISYTGLMTMAPIYSNPNNTRTIFRQLKNTLNTITNQNSHLQNMQELSMGMSQDFEIAIEEGSTCIRIGTDLFKGIGSTNYE